MIAVRTEMNKTESVMLINKEGEVSQRNICLHLSLVSDTGDERGCGTFVLSMAIGEPKVPCIADSGTCKLVAYCIGFKVPQVCQPHLPHTHFQQANQ